MGAAENQGICIGQCRQKRAVLITNRQHRFSAIAITQKPCPHIVLTHGIGCNRRRQGQPFRGGIAWLAPRQPVDERQGEEQAADINGLPGRMAIFQKSISAPAASSAA